MLKTKLYNCKFEGCTNKQVILSKGMCNYHRKSTKKKVNTSIFFKYHLEKVSKRPFCANCGCKLICNVSNIAHILPKRSTANPEVADNLLNALYLCGPFEYNGNNCHSKFDSNQGNIKVYEMKCFEEAWENYQNFKSDVTNYNKYVEILDNFRGNREEIED